MLFRSISLTFTKVDATCGNSDGSIDVTVTGGTAPYTYLWSNGATSQDLTAIPAATYTLTVTDAKGCVKSLIVPVGSTGGTVSDISGPVVVCDYVPPGPLSNQLVKYQITISCGTPTSIQWVVPGNNSTFVVVGPTNTTDLQLQLLAGFDSATFTVNIDFKDRKSTRLNSSHT